MKQNNQGPVPSGQHCASHSWRCQDRQGRLRRRKGRGGRTRAAPGAALYAAPHGKKLLAAVLLMLPVRLALMLSSLIFGGLTSSGSAGQPILNDNAAIVQNTNDIAFAVNQVLGEGIADAEARIARDFASTGGGSCEIVNLF